MDELIKELAQARAAAANAKENLKQLEAELLNNPVYIQLKETASEIADTVSQMEEHIKAEAKTQFALDGNKKPHAAVTIKMFSTVSILHEPTAREWCFSNFRPALKLDTKTFENAVKDGNVPIDIATASEEPRAQIASDLSKYLAE